MKVSLKWADLQRACQDVVEPFDPEEGHPRLAFSNVPSERAPYPHVHAPRCSFEVLMVVVESPLNCEGFPPFNHPASKSSLHTFLTNAFLKCRAGLKGG